MSTYRDILRVNLLRDEGKLLSPYPDTRGKVTIGIGHNLTDNGLSDAAVEFIYEEDVAIAESAARQIVPTLDSLSDVRKAVLVEMAFNLGLPKLAGFHNMLDCIGEGDWDLAADAMLDSLWAKEVGARATRLATMMRSDEA